MCGLSRFTRRRISRAVTWSAWRWDVNAVNWPSLCAETVAVSGAMNAGHRGGLVAVAVIGGKKGAHSATITPCGRCRQVLNELAQLGGTDPVIWCAGGDAVLELRLSDLLPHAFGPANLV